MPDRPVGRCIGCMHDFSDEEFCGGCGAMEHPEDKWIREGDAEVALIAAERQATPKLSDHELGILVADVYTLGEGEPSFTAIGRAVRDALGAWPSVPEGWKMLSVEWNFVVERYEAQIINREDPGRQLFGEHPTDPQAALAEAVRQAEESGK